MASAFNGGQPSAVSRAASGTLTRKLSLFLDLDKVERDVLSRLESPDTTIPARTDIAIEGEAFDSVHVIVEGWAMRHKALPDGRRQVTHFALPGDVLGFNTCVFNRADQSETAVTPIRTAQHEPDSFCRLMIDHPRLALGLTWCHAMERSMLNERLLSLGRRTAYERTAYLIMELWRRLEILGLTQGDRMGLPVTQEILADALGLSTPHLNRTLRQLRQDGLIEQRPHLPREIHVKNMPRLEAAAGFTGGFTFFTERPSHLTQNARN